MMPQPEWAALVQDAGQAFDADQFDRAVELGKRVLQMNPNCAEAYQVLGMVSARRGGTHDAIPLLETALRLRPDLVQCHNELGMVYTRLGEVERSLEQFERTLILLPDHRFARFNRALAWLKQGRLREGWVEYEWRWYGAQLSRPEIPRPRWDGSPLNGRGILVHTEQGVGDTLQFARFLPQLQQLGGKVVFACQTAVQQLLKSAAGVDEWMPIGEPAAIDFDVYTPMLSLPGLLNIHSEADLQYPVPYVFPEPQRLEYWQPKLAALPGLKVGVGWQGSPTFRGDKSRSIPLEKFSSIADVPGVSLVSLQKVDGLEQIESNRERVPLTVFPEMDADAPFVDTAAVMQHLDLIITSDTAIAHLAGALGRPVWVLLSTASDWRFLIDRPDSPWYPTMRLFRQQTLDDWDSVFADVGEALKRRIADPAFVPGQRQSQTIHVPAAAGELIDKITILEIKQERISDAAKLNNIQRELDLLCHERDQLLTPSAELTRLTQAMKDINQQLWQIEDDIRECELQQDFGPRFIELARSVYRTNDRRSEVKRAINQLLGSTIVEEKSYADYTGGKSAE